MVKIENIMKIAAALVFFVVLAGPAVAQEGGFGGGSDPLNYYFVDAVHGNDDNEGLTPGTAFATIRKGINTAKNGDVIRVFPGLYQEEVDYRGKAIVVQGIAAGTAGVPVLHNPNDFAVSFYSGEGPDSVLKNFIIKSNFMAVFIAGSSPTIGNLTIVDNLYGIEASSGSEPDISNIIFWNNIYSDMYGCRARYSRVDDVSVDEGRGNIDSVPLFVDLENGDYRLRSKWGRYWPEHDVWILDRMSSPCIDGGDPSAEPLNEPQPNGGRINMGAYGGTSQASLSLTEENLPGQASNPSPADSAVDVDTEVILSWTPGANADSHNVYFGTELDFRFGEELPVNPELPFGRAFMGNQTETEFDPDWLRPNTTYFWRIDEVNSNGMRTGLLWSFTTKDELGPPPKGRTCFLGDTSVWVDGKLVQISNVTAGQLAVKVVCPATGTRQIEKLEEHEGTFTCYDVLLESGNCISVAENHYFLTESGQWMSLKELTAGIHLKTSKGSTGITSVTKRPNPYVGNVYNLNIAGSDRYFVGKDAIIVRDF